jgi:glycosyltransferase involved in cell wall biosynthesis
LTSNLSFREEEYPASGAYRFPACFIIPTYNRASALMSCLEHLERQTFTDFEVIVVDDGSTDSTPQQMGQYQAVTPLRLRYVRQENGGPARARNVAISLAQAPLCLIIGDDILISPDFVAIHLQFHRENPDSRFAGLGLTRWSESGQKITPFMRWLDESGSQFAYQDLLHGADPDWKYFYTSNLSVKTELLRQNPFNEQFTLPMMEDMELGYRLEVQHGLKVVFLPQALADHIHPTDFRRACSRAYKTGLALRIFDQLWPDRPVTPHGWLHRATVEALCRNPWILPPLTLFAETLTRFWCPNPFIRVTLAYHAALGRRSRE